MSLGIVISASLLCFVYIILLLHSRRRPKYFPPGPLSWPLLGNLMQVGARPYESAMAMRKKYGDIIGLDLGTKRAVFINEHKLLREAFNMPALAGRPYFFHYAEPETGIARGIVFSSEKTWVEQRRFAFSYIQSGFRNGTSMESLVMNEISELIEDLKKSSGVPMNTRHAFNISTVNALWSIIAGRRYSINDQKFKKMIGHNSYLTTSPLGLGLLSFFPRFSKMWPKLSGYNNFRYNFMKVLEFMEEIIDEHKETYQDGTERDFVDAYLHKIQTTTDSNSTFYGETGESNLVHSLFDLFFAGTDTISSTLVWVFFLMAYFPEVQKKLINAIKLRLEDGQSILLKDKTSCPYVEAVIQEVLRFSGMAPLGVFRENLEDLDFHGYKIPKGTMIVANQYGIMHDPEVWGDPENFRPERFLNEDETDVIRHPALVPFGTGRRICPGEAFARDELFLFTTCIFQNFKVRFDPSEPIPPMKYMDGAIVLPVNHRIIFNILSE